MPPRGDFQLAIGYWVVSHKATLKTWWAILLMAIIFFSALWLTITLTVFFSQEKRVDGRIISSAQAISSFAPAALTQPTSLTAGVATIIDRGDGHYDLMADLKNPNQQWGASVIKVHFVLDGRALPTITTFVNANSSRPVIALNQKADQAQTATLAVDAITWVRDQGLVNESFAADKITVNPTTVTKAGQSITTVALAGQLTNNSVYNFYHVTVPVIVRNGESIVAVDELAWNNWATLTTRPINITWSFPVGAATTAEIVPQVNIYDLANRY